MKETLGAQMNNEAHANNVPPEGPLTRIEHAALLSGKSTWETHAIPRLGIPSIVMSDGPHGVRKQAGSADHLGINASLEATCFPTASAVAASWDTALGEEIGEALGQEAAQRDVNVLLGPGLNMKRSPLGGRNFEYFSEDPYLAGKMAAAYVRGIQAHGGAACPKHFAVNSQETMRMTTNSVVDEGTLREIYLAAFEIMVKEAHPKAIMSSYNLLGGTYTHENAHLLTEILREEWGFDGAVVTDWGGGNDPLAAIEAGGTIEMPSPGFDSVSQLLTKSGVNLEALAARAEEAAALARNSQAPKPGEGIFAQHYELAQRASESSSVLLKNEGILPLKEGLKVAVVGDFATTPRYQGAGSSLVNSTRVITPLDALRERMDVSGFAQGFKRGEGADMALIDEACQLAAKADVVVAYLGLDEFFESEGKDREHMHLPDAQGALITKLVEANPNVVVVMSTGSPVEMPWIDRVPAVLLQYLSGQEGGTATARILTGEVNPSGHLAETFPLALADTPTAGRFPALTSNIFYTEGPYIGYRYYSSAQVPVAFPFGFGLSYTRFAYSDFTASDTGVTFTVKNVGERAGACVPQVYVSPSEEAKKFGPRPARELKAFTKVYLEAGESREITLPFDDYTFRVWDRTRAQWVWPTGTWKVMLAENAEAILATCEITREGDTCEKPHPATLIEAYATGDISAVREADFAILLGHGLPSEPQSGVFTYNTPLAATATCRSWLGRAIYKHYFVPGMKKMERTGKPDLNLLFQYAMPPRAMAKMSGGLVTTDMAMALTHLLNGHFFAGLGRFISGFFDGRKRAKALARDLEVASSAAPTASTPEQA